MMQDFTITLAQIIASPLFLAPLLSLILSQILKSIDMWVKEKRVSKKYLVTDGGMVSSHSSVMTSITLMILLIEGATTAFFLALMVSLVVFRDSYGVRLQTGKQAVVINEITKAMKLKEEHLKEMIGHTKRQVINGILIGLAVSLIMYGIL